MTDDSNLNESYVSHQNRASWLVIASKFCLLYGLFAICTIIWALTIYNIDVYGKPEYRKPYDWLIESIIYTGLTAIPVGFVCGLWALLFRKDREFQSLAPTLILGLLLAGFALLQYRTYQYWHPSLPGDPPMVVPVTIEPKGGDQ